MKAIWFLIACLALSGCKTIDYTVTKRSAIDAQIVAAREETATKLKALNEKELDLVKQTVTAKDAQLQSASNYLFKGSVVGSTLKEPTRPEMVMVQSINQTAAQLPPVTPAAQAEALKALQTELDESKVSTAQLKAQYETELGQARAKADAQEKAVTQLASSLAGVQQDKVSILQAANQKEAALSDARKQASDEALAAEAAKLAKAKSDEKVKLWIVGILLTAAAACALGAAFLPIPSAKPKLIIGAAICGGGAIAIPFITPVFVMAIVGGLVVCTGAWLLLDYHHEHSDATDTYRAIQEVKTKAPDVFNATVAPVLQEWHTDPKTGQRIDKTLKAVGDV